METRTAIVTGASRGLGLALTAELVRRSWRVVVDGRDAHALLAAVEQLGNAVVVVPGDVTDPGHRADLVRAAGPDLVLVVNNAGGLGPSPLPALADYPLDALADLVGVNVIAPLALIQQALPTLRANRGTVVNVTSDASVEAYEGWGGYGATKAALDHLGAVLAAEEPDVRVLTIDPGDMRTRMHQDAFPGEDISDRPLPDESAPGIVSLVDGDEPSGRYRASSIASAGEVVPA
jgi:NAD(P)-dependent dehydrogenase (short-subunit alcohol dehydrogenase family)